MESKAKNDGNECMRREMWTVYVSLHEPQLLGSLSASVWDQES